MPLNQIVVNEVQEQHPLKVGEQTKQYQQQQLLLYVNNNFGTKNLKVKVPQLSPTAEENCDDYDLSQTSTHNLQRSINIKEEETSYCFDQHSISNGVIKNNTSIPDTTATLLNCTVNLTAQSNNQLNSTITTSIEEFTAESVAVHSKVGEVTYSQEEDKKQQQLVNSTKHYQNNLKYLNASFFFRVPQ